MVMRHMRYSCTSKIKDVSTCSYVAVSGITSAITGIGWLLYCIAVTRNVLLTETCDSVSRQQYSTVR